VTDEGLYAVPVSLNHLSLTIYGGDDLDFSDLFELAVTRASAGASLKGLSLLCGRIIGKLE
jgi:hypothetical protein